MGYSEVSKAQSHIPSVAEHEAINLLPQNRLVLDLPTLKKTKMGIGVLRILLVAVVYTSWHFWTLCAVLQGAVIKMLIFFYPTLQGQHRKYARSRRNILIYLANVFGT